MSSFTSNNIWVVRALPHAPHESKIGVRRRLLRPVVPAWRLSVSLPFTLSRGFTVQNGWTDSGPVWLKILGPWKPKKQDGLLTNTDEIQNNVKAGCQTVTVCCTKCPRKVARNLSHSLARTSVKYWPLGGALRIILRSFWPRRSPIWGFYIYTSCVFIKPAVTKAALTMLLSVLL